MRTIHRYDLEIVDEQRVPTYEGARLLAVHGESGRQLELWAEVDLTAPRIDRIVHVVGTGGRMPEGRGRLDHVGTVVMQHPRGRGTWHVFDGGESRRPDLRA